MIHYLELPYTRCKNCQRFDPTSSRSYDKCFDDECPAKEVQIVIRDSFANLAKKYVKAVKDFDFSAQRDILVEVQARGRGFEYKFKREVQHYGNKE